jgi:hypothetical protein
VKIHRSLILSLSSFAGIAIATLAPAATPLAASPAAVDRVVQSVDASKRVALATTRVAWASANNDAGEVESDRTLSHLHIALKRSPERKAAFDALVRDQQDPSSPDYHRWLTPSEIGERYGASDHDIDAVSAWLRSEGLTVEGVSNGRTRIRFGGSAAAIAAAFSTSLHYFDAAGEKRIATTGSPEIPAALADVVASVQGLQSVRYRPAMHVSAPRIAALSTHPAGSNCGGTTCDYTVFPNDFSIIYDVYPLYSEGIDGRNQKIAIIGRSRVLQADLDAFSSLSGFTVAGPPNVIIPPDGADPGDPLSTCPDPTSSTCGNPDDQINDQTEATLDVQRASAVARGANIDLIVSATSGGVDGTNYALDYAIDNDPVPAKIISMSYTSCEADNDRGVAMSLDDFFQQGAAEGISIFIASGDGGVAGCASLDSPPQPGEPVSTNILCASSYVTCVGGTEFADSDNPDAYWSRTNGTGYQSALSYIPEGAWNEPLDADGHPQLASTGGGFSNYIATPSWQSFVGNQGRYTPDVSLNASTREGYFTCIAAFGASCVATNGGFSFLNGGGTSASTPSMAGIAAMLNQRQGTSQGNMNPRMYALATEASAAAFHDVTVASSGVDNCTVATPSLCNNTIPGTSGLAGGLQGYLVKNGYDLATGLGSPDAKNFVANWSAGSATAIDLNQAGLTGSWYNPATSGQGIVMEVVPNLIGSGRGVFFGGWFTWDTTAAGGQRWYSLQGEMDSGAASATMPIYLSEGGNFDAPPAVGVTPVGTATFAFSDCTHGTLAYSFDDGSGRSGTIPLTRLGANSACSNDGSGAIPPEFLLSGAWYNAITSGQGFVVDVNTASRSMFITWYTFALDGQTIGGPASQRWYTIQGGFTPGTHRYDNVPIYNSSGGVFDNAAPVTTQPVGSANLDFHSCSSATLSYVFTDGENSGHSGTIELSRATPAVDGCGL